MEWSVVYTTITFMVVGYIFLGLLSSSNPGSLLILFLSFVLLTVWNLFLYTSDLMTYLLFLVYVGGLLVLLIYVIMLSSNYMVRVANVSYFLFLVGLLGALYSSLLTPITVDMSSHSCISPLNFSILLFMGTLLTYLFLNICNVLGLGGTTLNVSKT